MHVVLKQQQLHQIRNVYDIILYSMKDQTPLLNLPGFMFEKIKI